MANTQAPELRQETFPKEESASRRPKPAPAPAGSGKRKPLTILTLLIVVAAIIGVVAWFLTRNYESTDDAFIDGHVIDASPRISAQVTEVYFNDNQEVKQGDLLVQLDPRSFQVAVEKAQAQLAQAKAQAGQARAQLAQQSAQAVIAGQNFNRDSSLFHQDIRAVAKEDVETTKATLDAASASVQAAQSEIGSADAAVQAAQASLDDATLNRSYTEIRAAESGRVAHKSVEVGDYVTPGQTLFSIVQHDVWVTANFKETQLTRMREGQPVTVHIDAFPDRDLKAHVDSFQPGTGSRFSVLPAENATGNYVKVVQRIPVKIVFDEPEDVLMNLGPGMSVEPKVNVAAPGRE
jgi:membrane fusion protein (multidrug efflux system)